MEPHAKMGKKTMEEWAKLQSYVGNEFVAILEKERWELKDTMFMVCRQGLLCTGVKVFIRKLKFNQGWVRYISKYMLKEPLGFWSNI